MKKHARNLILLLLFIGVIVALRMSGAGELLTLENLRANKDALLAFVRENGALSVALYILVYIVAIAVNLPGGAVLTMAGGFLFGTLPAVLCVNVGATTGAVLAFLSARYLLGARLQDTYRDRLAAFNSEMTRNGARYLLTLRLIPVFPFFVVNFLAGLTRVPLATFAWTTALGIIPGTAVFAFAGHQLETVSSLGDVFTGKVLGAFLLLALFPLAPALIGRFRKDRSAPPSP
ncbi:MAG: TVP38/TMEM64 family protein [Nitrospirota bacterium]